VARTALGGMAAGALLSGRPCVADELVAEAPLLVEESVTAPAPLLVEESVTAPAPLLVEESVTAPSAPAPPALAPPAPAPPIGPTAFDFSVPFRGEPEAIRPFLGKVSLFVNVKYDDPVTTDQLPALQTFVDKYSKEGLRVLAFPTDQGWFEADDSASLRLKFKQAFNFGQYPVAMVFDKADLLGSNSLPLYTWLTRTLSNPWGVTRIVFNYEKFLLDENGMPLRRYPRKYPVGFMEEDLKAALEGRPLPPPNRAYVQAWEDAKREATKSEYAFKPGLNYYTFGSPAS